MNLPTRRVGGSIALNRDLLDATDLVIGNPEAFVAMSRGELDMLQQAIRNGLGILLVNEVPVKEPCKVCSPVVSNRQIRYHAPEWFGV